MSRCTTSTVDRPCVGLVGVTAVEIPDDTFHRAIAAATAHTNTAAGETFTFGNASYVRVNERHFRIEAVCGHADALAIVGRSAAWRRVERCR